MLTLSPTLTVIANAEEAQWLRNVPKYIGDWATFLGALEDLDTALDATEPGLSTWLAQLTEDKT